MDKETSIRLQNWLLEHEEDNKTDRILLEILNNSENCQEDNELGFAEFVQRTKMKHHVLSRRLAISLASIISAVIVSALALVIIGHISANDSWCVASAPISESNDILLADGTKVRLYEGSQIVYPRCFNKKNRQVFISGQAFFDVTKNEKKKFVVSTSSMDIVVHGTRFIVNSSADCIEDEVALLEGSVEILLNDNSGTLMLEPGEKIRYSKSSKTSERGKIAVNYYEEIVNNGGLHFYNATFRDIVSRLNRQFDSIVIIEDPVLENERFIASFINGESLEEILTSLNVKNLYKIVSSGDTLHIYKNKSSN